MGYTEFNPNVKKVNLKPKGEVEIILTTSLSDLRGSVETLSNMIDQKVRVALESNVVSYNVQINARTEKPLTTYKVDENGIVSQVQPEGEQLELDLNVPKKKDPIKDVPEEIDREIVDEFILALLAPSYDDMPYPFYAWIFRLSEGDTYSQIASVEEMSSGKLVDLIDEYRARVAPLAAKWDEWRQNGGATAEVADQSEDKAVDQNQSEADQADQADRAEQNSSEDIVLEDGQQQKPVQATEDELTDWEKEIMGETQQPNNDDSEPAVEDLDDYILQAKPAFDDIPYDFPSLLVRKKQGETWMEIAKSIGTRSGLLSTAWSKYRKKVKELRNGGAA
jgi:hypothetical protein